MYIQRKQSADKMSPNVILGIFNFGYLILEVNHVSERNTKKGTLQ